MEAGAAAAAVVSGSVGMVTGIMRGGGYGRQKKTMMEIRWAVSKRKTSKKLPIYISSNPSDINLLELRDLYSTCNHSCHRFPPLQPDGKSVESVDINKLKIALSHSSVVVSVFCNLQDLKLEEEEEEERRPAADPMGLLRRITPNFPFPLVSPSNSNSSLVGFGRAVSDFGLTASIYDAMVIPSLRRMGIGQMIVNKIVRILTNRDIYDIAALCSANERLFFKACGFGDDILGSTTLMYARTLSTYPQGDQMVAYAGRKILLVPPLRKPFEPS